MVIRIALPAELQPRCIPVHRLLQNPRAHALGSFQLALGFSQQYMHCCILCRITDAYLKTGKSLVGLTDSFFMLNAGVHAAHRPGGAVPGEAGDYLRGHGGRENIENI